MISKASNSCKKNFHYSHMIMVNTENDIGKNHTYLETPRHA